MTCSYQVTEVCFTGLGRLEVFGDPPSARCFWRKELLQLRFSLLSIAFREVAVQRTLDKDGKSEKNRADVR